MTLGCLSVWPDGEPRDGPLNMALDEALLLMSSTPVLRVYGWSGPWVSFGCFGALAETQAAFPGRPLVRRGTGGGIVDHAADWTYSLIVPRGDPLATLGTAESYRFIHAALATALAAVGVTACLADAPPPGRGDLCFQRPVLADVVDAAGRKLAGAAQRRTRFGLLHQGSVQGVGVPASLTASLTASLASALCPSPLLLCAAPPADVLALAESLAREKYGTAAWNDRR